MKIYLVSREADFMEEGHTSSVAVKCFSAREDAVAFAASEAKVSHKGEVVASIVREETAEEVVFSQEDSDGHFMGRMRVEPIDLC